MSIPTGAGKTGALKRGIRQMVESGELSPPRQLNDLLELAKQREYPVEWAYKVFDRSYPRYTLNTSTRPITLDLNEQEKEIVVKSSFIPPFTPKHINVIVTTNNPPEMAQTPTQPDMSSTNQQPMSKKEKLARINELQSDSNCLRKHVDAVKEEMDKANSGLWQPQLILTSCRKDNTHVAGHTSGYTGLELITTANFTPKMYMQLYLAEAEETLEKWQQEIDALL